MSWYALRVAPQRECAMAGGITSDGEHIDGILTRRGYDVFLPLEGIPRRVRQGSGPRTTVWRPYFPGYVFVRSPSCWLHLMSERHIIGVVGFDGTPAPISDEAIAPIMGKHGLIRPDASLRRKPKIGDRVRIASGPFVGHVVKIEGLHGMRAKVFLNLFGTVKAVEISADKLEAA